MTNYRALFFIMLFSLSMSATDSHNVIDQELFTSANQLYEQGLFQDALTKYTDIKQKNSAVYHNMGNCYFYINQYAHALAYWNKAMKGSSYAMRKHIYALQKNIPEYNTYRSWWNIVWDEITWFLSTWSLLFLQILFLICWFFLCALWLYSSKKRYLFGCLSISVILIIFLWVKWIDEQPRCFVSTQTHVFVGPNSSYQTIGQLKPLCVASVLNTSEEWCKVRHGNIKGWVMRKHILVI